MPRMPRLVVPGFPHHVTQRGARRQTTFFKPADYRTYLELLRNGLDDGGVEIWGYCLMPNHVHFVAVPQNRAALARLFGAVHHRYAREINLRQGWQGHLWQARFHSCVMDEAHLLAAVRYIEMNPVAGGLCEHPEDWPWSSARAHLAGVEDPVLKAAAMRQYIDDWQRFLEQSVDTSATERVRQCSRNGRPAAGSDFIAKLEAMTGRRLRPLKPGPK